MFNPLKQGAAIKKMYDIQRALSSENITVEKNGVVIVISGDQKIKTLETNGKSDDDIKEAVNEAIKKSFEKGYGGHDSDKDGHPDA